MRWLWSISPTQIWVWLFNDDFQGLWCKTEPECVQSLLQLWHRWPDSLLVTDINGCHAGLGCAWCCSPLLSIVYGCDQLVVAPTHGGTLDLLMTGVLDLVQAAVVAPIGNSDHSSPSAVILMAQTVPNLCINRKVYPKHQVNRNTVCVVQYSTSHGITFGFLTILLSVWTSICQCLLDIMYQLKLSLCTTRNCQQTHNCRHAFSPKQEALRRWTRDHFRVKWEEFVYCQVRANETYSEAKHLFSDRNRDGLMNVQSPHKWWSTLKSAVFSLSLSLPPFVSRGWGLVCESVGKADLSRII